MGRLCADVEEVSDRILIRKGIKGATMEVVHQGIRLFAPGSSVRVIAHEKCESLRKIEIWRNNVGWREERNETCKKCKDRKVSVTLYHRWYVGKHGRSSMYMLKLVSFHDQGHESQDLPTREVWILDEQAEQRDTINLREKGFHLKLTTFPAEIVTFYDSINKTALQIF